MDVFNHNWTEKMKDSPLVNKLLNNYPVHDDRGLIEYTVIQKIKDPKYRNRFKTSQKHRVYPWSQRERRRFNFYTDRYGHPPWWPGIEHADQGKTYLVDDLTLNYREPGYYVDPKYHSNTRPHSLYNLHYSSLR